MKRIDITGRKFNSWEVLNYSHTIKKNGMAVWRCKCLECGNIKLVRGGSLPNGLSKNCGCVRYAKFRNPESKLNILLHQYKSNANKRKLVFELTKLEFANIVNKNCAYCDIEPNPMNGIDRVDNSKGYTIENSVPCCSICNHAKKTMSLIEFFAWIQKVYKNTAWKKVTLT